MSNVSSVKTPRKVTDATRAKRLSAALAELIGACDCDYGSEPDSIAVEVPRSAVERARSALRRNAK